MDLANLRDTIVESVKSTLETLQNPRALTESFQNLTFVKKMEMAAAGLVFLVSAGFLAWNWSFWTGASRDSTIMVSRGPAHRVSATAPKTARGELTGLSGWQGRLELVESNTERGIRFMPAPEMAWQACWSQWTQTRDGARQMLLLAAIGIANQRNWRLSGAAHLSAEQSKAEDALCRGLQEDMASLEQSALEGSFASADGDKVFQALEAYRQAQTDAAKQTSAAQVMAAGMKYSRKLEDARQKLLNDYADAVAKLLEPAQREALRQAAAQLALHSGTPAATEG